VTNRAVIILSFLLVLWALPSVWSQTGPSVVFAQFSHPPIGPGSIVPIGPSTGTSSGGGGGCVGALDLSTGCALLMAFGGLF